MSLQNSNKEFIKNYFRVLSASTDKPRELLEEYISDQELIGHIDFFETVFPKYEIVADEFTAEEDRVVVKARLKGTHKGELNGIAPTNKTVEVQFVICYQIENNKIISHWMLVDQLSLMQQLGVMPVAEGVH